MTEPLLMEYTHAGPSLGRDSKVGFPHSFENGSSDLKPPCVCRLHFKDHTEPGRVRPGILEGLLLELKFVGSRMHAYFPLVVNPSCCAVRWCHLSGVDQASLN